MELWLSVIRMLHKDYLMYKMIHPTYFDVLARMLRAMGATVEEADRCTASYLFGESNTAASQHKIQMREDALRRASVAFPNVHSEHVPAPLDVRLLVRPIFL
jgi:hypothetical protein